LPVEEGDSVASFPTLFLETVLHLLCQTAPPNPSIERTSLSWLRQPKAAAHVER
jgi:hypothetical protein